MCNPYLHLLSSADRERWDGWISESERPGLWEPLFSPIPISNAKNNERGPSHVGGVGYGLLDWENCIVNHGIGWNGDEEIHRDFQDLGGSGVLQEVATEIVDTIDNSHMIVRLDWLHLCLWCCHPHLIYYLVNWLTMGMYDRIVSLCSKHRTIFLV